MRVTLAETSDIMLNNDLDYLQVIYEEYGLEVQRIKAKTADGVFHRDVAVWTPWGHVMCNMAKQGREYEPEYWFSKTGIEPALVIEDGHLEGADVVRIEDNHWLIGMGQRTSTMGAMQLASWLKEKGAEAETTTLPSDHEQHALGVGNVVYHDGKRHWVQPTFTNYKEARSQKVTNWVQVPGERPTVIIPALETVRGYRNRLVEKHGLFLHEVSVPGLKAHGGGVACATGIVMDLLLPDPKDESTDDPEDEKRTRREQLAGGQEPPTAPPVRPDGIV